MCGNALRRSVIGIYVSAAMLVSLWVGDSVSAQPVPVPPSPPEVATPDSERPWREQTIYVPYTRLREMFEKQGRGVFLPYEKFQELWQAAKAARPAPADFTPPVGALVAEIDSTATVDRDVLKVTAKLQIELLAPGWHRVPLRLGDCALLSAKFGDQPALVLYDNQGYYLLVRSTPRPAPAAVIAAAAQPVPLPAMPRNPMPRNPMPRNPMPRNPTRPHRMRPSPTSHRPLCRILPCPIRLPLNRPSSLRNAAS